MGQDHLAPVMQKDSLCYEPSGDKIYCTTKVTAHAHAIEKIVCNPVNTEKTGCRWLTNGNAQSVSNILKNGTEVCDCCCFVPDPPI